MREKTNDQRLMNLGITFKNSVRGAVERAVVLQHCCGRCVPQHDQVGAWWSFLIA